MPRLGANFRETPLLYLVCPWIRSLDLAGRSLLAALTAAALGALLFPWAIRHLRKWKMVEPTKGIAGLDPTSKKGVPIMGGVVLLLAFYAASLLWCDLSNSFVQVSLGWSLAFAVLGFVDDWEKVRPAKRGIGLSQPQKYAVQIVLTALLAWLLFSEAYLPISRTVAQTLYLPFNANWHWDLSWGFLLVLFLFFIFTSNAINIMDGLDGLVTFPVMLVAGVLAVMAWGVGDEPAAAAFGFPYLPGSSELAVLLVGLLGACGAFLWHNAFPATIFMGDTGAMALGGLLGTIAILLRQEVLFLIAGGVFVIEAGSSAIQNYIGVGILGRRLFFRAPLHHSLLYRGVSEPKVTVRFWLLAVVFAALALFTLEMRR